VDCRQGAKRAKKGMQGSCNFEKSRRLLTVFLSWCTWRLGGYFCKRQSRSVLNKEGPAVVVQLALPTSPYGKIMISGER
jgi:hypothetical protein